MPKPVVVTPPVLDALGRSRRSPCTSPQHRAGIGRRSKPSPKRCRSPASTPPSATSRGERQFALPREYYDKGVRRYGLRPELRICLGEIRRFAPLLHAGRVVVAHLGNRRLDVRDDRRPLDGPRPGPPGPADGHPPRPDRPRRRVLTWCSRKASRSTVRDLFYDRSGLLGLFRALERHAHARSCGNARANGRSTISSSAAAASSASPPVLGGLVRSSSAAASARIPLHPPAHLRGSRLARDRARSVAAQGEQAAHQQLVQPPMFSSFPAKREIVIARAAKRLEQASRSRLEA